MAMTIKEASMIKINSDRCRSLDNMFDSISGSTNFMEVDNDG